MRTDRTPSEKARAAGRRLRAFRKSQGLSTMEVANRLGCTQTNIQHYEIGRNKIALDRLRDFADALNCNPHDLYEIVYPVAPPVEASARSDTQESVDSDQLPRRTSGKVTVPRIVFGIPSYAGSLVRC